MRDEAPLRFGADVHRAIPFFHCGQQTPAETSSPTFSTDIHRTSSLPQTTSDTLNPFTSALSDLQMSQSTVLPVPVPAPLGCTKSPMSPAFDGLLDMYSDYPTDLSVELSPTGHSMGQAGSAESLPESDSRTSNVRSNAAKRALNWNAGEGKLANTEVNLGCLGFLPSSVNGFNKLPMEIRIRVFKLLKMEELVRISRVCRCWLRLAYDGSLWNRLDIRQVSRSISNEQIVNLYSAAGNFLRIVNFRGCVQISSATLRRLGEICPNIRAAQLTGCRSISSRSLIRFVSRCRYLQSLDVSGLNSVTGAVLNALAEANQGHLEELHIAKCRSLKGKDVHRILETRQNLLSLKLGSCRLLDASIFPLIKQQVQLRHLSLAQCGFVSLEHVKTLFPSESQSPSSLISLDIAGNLFVCDETIQNVASRCPRLRHLDAEECSQITDASLFSLAQHTPKLQILSVAQCDLITDTGIARLVRNCRELQRLEMDCCGSITDATLQDITDLLKARSASESPTSDSGSTCAGSTTSLPASPIMLSEIGMFDCRSVTRQGLRNVGTKVHGLKVKCFYTWQDQEEERRARHAEVELLDEVMERNRRGGWRRNSANNHGRRIPACTIL